MSDSNCIFCKISTGEIPCFKLAETETVLAFLDIAPIAKAHAVIIPKQHFETALAADPAIFKDMYDLAQKIAKTMQKLLNCSGFNFLINNGKVAGQTVFHLHLHIIPRFENDEIQWAWNQKPLDQEFGKNLTEQINKTLCV